MDSTIKLDNYKIFSNTFRFFIMGLAIAMLVNVIPTNELALNETLMISVAASLIYAIIEINYKC